MSPATPATLGQGREVSAGESGYEAKRAAAVDMFPRHRPRGDGSIDVKER